MIPFLVEDLFSTAKNLMGLIIKQDILSSIVNGRQLQRLDFTKEENFLSFKSITLEFAAERNTIELRRKDVLYLNEVKRFLKDCRLIIIGILEKTFERSLNGSSFLEAAGCIRPKSILSKPTADLLQQMKSVLHLIFSCSHITSSECDVASIHFSKFLEESSFTLLPVFKEFHAGNRLDQFYFETVKVNVNYKVLSKVLILVFTLGHGQSSIERGFIINSNMLSENIKRKVACLSLHYQGFHGVQQIEGSPSGNHHPNDKGRS